MRVSINQEFILGTAPLRGCSLEREREREREKERERYIYIYIYIYIYTRILGPPKAGHEVNVEKARK